MSRALSFIRWLVAALLIAVLIAKYGFGIEQARPWSLLLAVVWIVLEIVLRSPIVKSRAGDND